MKICHINFTFRQGGIPALLVDISNEQIKTNQVSIIVINNLIHDEMLAEVNPAVNVYLINRKPKSRNIFPLLKINYIIWRTKPDIIHCHHEDCIKSIFPVFRKKAVITVHDTLVKKAFFKGYKKLFAISEAVKYDVFSKYGFLSELVYNGINTSSIKVKTEICQTGVFKIIQIGRLITQTKGQHLSIEAFKELVYKHKLTNIHLDIIGWGEDFDFLNKMVIDYHLQDYITFLGLKDRTYIYSHICEYDLMLHPSLFEGFGLNLLEAMVAKVPVLVSDIEGPIEIIGNGKYGNFFKSGDIDNLIEKTLYILSNCNSESHKQMTEDAYHNVISNFDIKNTVHGYSLEYDKLLQSTNI